MLSIDADRESISHYRHLTVFPSRDGPLAFLQHLVARPPIREVLTALTESFIGRVPVTRDHEMIGCQITGVAAGAEVLDSVE